MPSSPCSPPLARSRRGDRGSRPAARRRRDDADAAALLDDELHARVGRILDERDRRREAGRVNAGAQLRPRIAGNAGRDGEQDGDPYDAAHVCGLLCFHRVPCSPASAYRCMNVGAPSYPRRALWPKYRTTRRVLRRWTTTKRFKSAPTPNPRRFIGFTGSWLSAFIRTTATPATPIDSANWRRRTRFSRSRAARPVRRRSSAALARALEGGRDASGDVDFKSEQIARLTVLELLYRVAGRSRRNRPCPCSTWKRSWGGRGNTWSFRSGS